jgi:3-oxoacyl-[acyl-carrier-protein] synthase II
MMQKGFIAPTLNLEQVDPECAGIAHVMGKGPDVTPRMIMSGNFAFGGVNATLIIGKGP